MPRSKDSKNLADTQAIELAQHSPVTASSMDPMGPIIEYRSYKRRFVGLVSLILLAATSGMAWPWFGPIANTVSDEFGFTLDQVNWISNIVGFVYLPVSILVPIVCARIGVRFTCYIGAVSLLVGSWVRYAGTKESLSTNQAYAVIIIGQAIGSIPQPIFQILVPKYSESWFNLKERTTATMVAAIANPVGGAIAQLLSPLFSTSRKSILYLGVISSASVPFVLLIGEKPPTPPTYSGSQSHPTFASLVRAMFGRESSDLPTYMTRQERVDFIILTYVFGIFVGIVNSFSVLTSQFFEPHGYSDDTSGFFGATLLLVGLVAAIISAPLFDRVFTHHLALTAKLSSPLLATSWLTLIWAVKPKNASTIYTFMGIIGGVSLTLLPVALELGAEVTRNADGSSAVLWFAGNVFGIMYVLVNGALRAPADAVPPLNMHRALVFQGATTCSTLAFLIFLRGRQVRREKDVSMSGEAKP